MDKKFLTYLVLILVGFMIFPTVAHADIGPKPSVQINFVGIDDTIYYITLLSKTESTGPYSFDQSPINEDSSLLDENKQEDMTAWKALRGYHDIDGFYFIDYFQRSNSLNNFEWGYYPPSTFKILIYFPEENRFISSGVQEKYAFDSYYQVLISENLTTMTVDRSYDYFLELFSFFARMLATLAVELIIALLFGLKKKNVLIYVLTVNVVTQFILNVLLNIVNYRSGGIGFILTYIFMELLIIFIEAAVFSLYFSKAVKNKLLKQWVAPVYAVVANSVSFCVGVLISIKLPGIF